MYHLSKASIVLFLASFEPWLSDLLETDLYLIQLNFKISASITTLSPPGMRSEYGLNGNCEDASSDLCTEISR